MGTGEILLIIVVPTLLAVAGWLIKRNEDQHEKLGEDVGLLKEGQAEIKGKLNLLIDLFKKNGSKHGS